MTPQQRSTKYLRDQGWRVAVVEHYNGFTKRRTDLFEIFDLLALRGQDTMGIQVTSSSNVAARVKKITNAVALNDIRKANWIIMVHGWRKNAAGRWTLREVDLS